MHYLLWVVTETNPAALCIALPYTRAAAWWARASLSVAKFAKDMPDSLAKTQCLQMAGRCVDLCLFSR